MGEAKLADLKVKVFPERELKVWLVKDGQGEVRVVQILSSKL